MENNIVNIVTILEHYEDEISCMGVFDYDDLPEVVQKNVDKALCNKDNSLGIKPYDNGLQFLYRYNHPMVKKGVNCVFKGMVEFWECY